MEKQDWRFKELNQRFDELFLRMDVIDKRYKDQGRRFQNQEHRFENLEQPFQRRDETSVQMKDIRCNCKTGGLSGQQARPQGEDAYSRESGESEDDKQSCNDFQACRE